MTEMQMWIIGYSVFAVTASILGIIAVRKIEKWRKDV